MLARLVPLAPGALIAVVGASAIAYVLDLSAHGVALVGAVPGGLPSVGLPAISVADAMALLGSAAAIAFVGYTDVALTGRAFAARTGEVIDANREFLALGVANVGAGPDQRVRPERLGIAHRDHRRRPRPQPGHGADRGRHGRRRRAARRPG